MSPFLRFILRGLEAPFVRCGRSAFLQHARRGRLYHPGVAHPAPCVHQKTHVHSPGQAALPAAINDHHRKAGSAEEHDTMPEPRHMRVMLGRPGPEWKP